MMKKTAIVALITLVLAGCNDGSNDPGYDIDPEFGIPPSDTPDWGLPTDDTPSWGEPTEDRDGYWWCSHSHEVWLKDTTRGVQYNYISEYGGNACQTVVSGITYDHNFSSVSTVNYSTKHLDDDNYVESSLEFNTNEQAVLIHQSRYYNGVLRTQFIWNWDDMTRLTITHDDSGNVIGETKGAMTEAQFKNQLEYQEYKHVLHFLVKSTRGFRE